jgi:hypothetical protein
MSNKLKTTPLHGLYKPTAAKLKILRSACIQGVSKALGLLTTANALWDHNIK